MAKKKESVADTVMTDAMVMDKKTAIEQSKMPEAHKKAYLRQLGLDGSDETGAGEKIPFLTYARIRGIGGVKQKAMLAYPQAQGVRLASPAEWDQLFKKF